MQLPEILNNIIDGEIGGKAIKSDEGVIVEVMEKDQFRVTYPDGSFQDYHRGPIRTHDLQPRLA